MRTDRLMPGEAVRRNPPPKLNPKPKPKLELRVPERELSPRMIQAIKADPASVEVRVTAKAEEVVVVDRPRRTEVVEVTEVDEFGRPKAGRRYDVATGQWDLIGYSGGYRQTGRVEHVYDPFERGWGGDHD